MSATIPEMFEARRLLLVHAKALEKQTYTCREGEPPNIIDYDGRPVTLPILKDFRPESGHESEPDWYEAMGKLIRMKHEHGRWAVANQERLEEFDKLDAETQATYSAAWGLERNIAETPSRDVADFNIKIAIVQEDIDEGFSEHMIRSVIEDAARLFGDKERAAA